MSICHISSIATEKFKFPLNRFLWNGPTDGYLNRRLASLLKNVSWQNKENTVDYWSKKCNSQSTIMLGHMNKRWTDIRTYLNDRIAALLKVGFNAICIIIIIKLPEAIPYLISPFSKHFQVKCISVPTSSKGKPTPNISLMTNTVFCIINDTYLLAKNCSTTFTSGRKTFNIMVKKTLQDFFNIWHMITK